MLKPIRHRRLLPIFALLVTLALAQACTSSTITPMKPLIRVEYVADLPTSQPATTPSTLASTAPTTQAPTQPTTAPATRTTTVKFVDPNQTTRFIFGGSYDHIWQQSIALLVDEGYRIDRQDYRQGVLTTLARSAAHLVEPWRADWVGAKHATENTINTQRRTVRITIKPVEDKPLYWEIATQVLVERESNPTETIQGPIFVEGSGFGRTELSLQSDFISTATTGATWRIEGHDKPAEKQILDKLFKRI